ncbi:MAG: HAD family hydrolase [Propioniciclava sp.]
MPLLLLDLDNTLVDRAVGYRRWAAEYLRERDADPALLEAMVRADGDGLRPKPEVAADLTALLQLTGPESTSIVRILRAGVVAHLELAAGCAAALGRARAAGWTPWIVSNGVTEQQEKKIHRLGLERLVDGWVISEEAGAAKPDPQIFTIAAQRAGLPLTGAWMVGDSAEADIIGAHRAGLECVYLHRGRAWDPALRPPNAAAGSLAEAITVVLSSTDAGRPAER